MRQSRITVIDSHAFEVMAKSMLHGYKNEKDFHVLILSVTRATAAAYVQSILRGPIPESVHCDGLDTFFQVSVKSPKSFVFLMPELGYLDKDGLDRVNTYLHQLDHHSQITTTRNVIYPLHQQMYERWLRDKDYVVDVRTSVPLPEDRVLHFTREHYNRYFEHGQFTTHREFPVIEADVVTIGREFSHLGGQALSYLFYKLTENSHIKGQRVQVNADSSVLETLFEHERWLHNNHGNECAMAECATVDPVREVLRPMNEHGYTVWREGKCIAVPYYDKQWSLVTPPVTRSKRSK